MLSEDSNMIDRDVLYRLLKRPFKIIDNNVVFTDDLPRGDENKIVKALYVARKSFDIKVIMSDYDESMRELVKTYPEMEQRTFAQKATEAQAYLQTKDKTTAPLLSAKVVGDEDKLEILCRAVLQKAQQLAQASGEIERIRDEKLMNLEKEYGSD